MDRAKKFGTFGGVFTPALLTILGVIMYLRLGWITGQAGLFNTIAIILVAHIISITTGLSLSSIATDKKIRAGGIYYMLSRSLGLPMGGAIGATIFSATAISIAFYLVGFAESFLAVDAVRNFLLLEQDLYSYKIIASAMLLFLVTVAFISTSLAIRVQYFVLTAIALSLVSFFAGVFMQPSVDSASIALTPSRDALPMDVIFAIFFPAVTGFTVGVAMSGDLKDPRRSIPAGTLWAIFAGLIIYLGLAITFAVFIDRETLLNDSSFMMRISLVPVLVLAGIWGATLSSALGGILGGPRIVQALARDKLAPGIFGRGFGINNEPRIAIIFTFLIAQAAIMIGDLNTIARVVTMFFITAYAFINLAFALESWASIDFRPSFKLPRWVGWLGFTASFLVMIQIDLFAMVIAFGLIWATWFIMKRRQQELEPGDVWQSVWANIVRKSVHNMYTKGIEERNWKPNIMLFSGNPDTRKQLIELGDALIADHGLLTIINLKKYQEGETAKARFQQIQDTDEHNTRPGVFNRVYYCHDIYQGINNLAETYGFAGVEPNTILMGWTRKMKEGVQFVQMIQHIIELDMNLLLMDFDTQKGFGKRKTIDIWWQGSGNNGNLALNLVKFLWLSEGWKESRLRLMIENRVNDDREQIYNYAREVLDTIRINAEIVIINNEIEKKHFYDLVRIDSGNTDITFLSIPDIKKGKENEFLDKMQQLCADLGSVVLIKASTQFKKLNIGIRPNALPLRTPSEKPIEITTGLTEEEIQWPNYPQLATSLKGFAEKSHGLNQDLINKSFGKVLGQYAEIINNAHNRVRSTYTIISGRLTENTHYRDTTETAKAFYKLSINSFARYEQILQYINDGLLDEQQKILEIYFAGFDQNIQSILNNVPLSIEVTEQVKWKVPFRKIILLHYPQVWHRIRKRIWKRFNALSVQYKSEQQKAFGEFRNSLLRLENALHNNQLTQEMISNEKNDIETVFTNLSDFLLSAQTSLMAIASEENMMAIRNIAKTLNSPKASTSRNRENQIIKNYEIRAMASYPAEWKQTQQLITNKYILDLSLIGVEYKLWHILKKVNEELNNEWNQAENSASQKISSRLIHFTEDVIRLVKEGKSIDKTIFNSWPDYELPTRIKDIEDTTHERINISLSKIPSHIELLKPTSQSDFTEYRTFVLDTLTVEVSKLVHFIVQNNLMSPMQKILKEFGKKFSMAEKEIIEINRLIKITLSPEKEEPLNMAPEVFFDEQRKRTMNVQAKVENLRTTTLDKLQATYNNTIRLLELNTFLKTAENLKLLERKNGDGLNKKSVIRVQLEKAKGFLRRNLIKIWYDRSKRIVYASQSISQEIEESFPISRLHALNDEVSVKKSVLNTIPLYYQQLFLRKNNYFMDFWHGKPAELEEAAKTIARHEKGYNGALMIRGENSSGKSFFVNYLVHKHLSKKAIYTVTPPFAGSVSEAEFVRALQRATENPDSIKKTLENLPDKSVIIIEDMELWWEKTPGGFKVIKLICNLIEDFGNRILFIITANSHAYKSINRFIKIDSHLLSVIDCIPFNAEELKNIIMLRHKSGSMKLVFDDIKESDMRSWDYAMLFNTYFNYTHGNVGLSLQTWMANIVRVADGSLYIKSPRRPDTSVLNKLNPETLIFLVQFILHKRLNIEKIQRIMLMNLPDVKEKIYLLKRAAIISEPQQGVFILNPNLHTFIREKFIEKELL
jgi:amino acid transporter